MRKKKVKLITALDIACPLKFCRAKPLQACIDRRGNVLTESFHAGREVEAKSKAKDLVYIGPQNGNNILDKSSTV